MTYDESAIYLVRDLLVVVLKICGPILAAGLVVGLVISILQAVTSIQDQTLSFVPKIVIMIVVAGVLLPWVVQKLIDYTAELFKLF